MLEQIFQSTRPVWGATCSQTSLSLFSSNFNPRAPCGARRRRIKKRKDDKNDFNPRAPCGARRWMHGTCGRPRAISIHAPRVGRDSPVELVIGLTEAISIHAPRVGRDDLLCQSSGALSYFNPRAPCGARLVGRKKMHKKWDNFNPRAPCGARHSRSPPGCRSLSYFNPRAPCGARRYGAREDGDSDGISIHAPRVGRDSKFDDFTPSNLHKRYKRVLARPKNAREKGKTKQKLAYIHAFSAFLGCEGSGTFCALVLRTQYR